MNNDDEKDYNNLPNFTMNKEPVEEGDVLNQNKDTNTESVGAAQDVNNIPDSPLADGNAEEANAAIADTDEES